MDLSTKALDTHLGGDVARQNFEYDLTAEIAVHRHEDATHSAGDELAFEGVAIAKGALESRAKVRHAANLWGGYSLRQRQ